jgi:hypothetical protein
MYEYTVERKENRKNKKRTSNDFKYKLEPQTFPVSFESNGTLHE